MHFPKYIGDTGKKVENPRLRKKGAPTPAKKKKREKSNIQREILLLRGGIGARQPKICKARTVGGGCFFEGVMKPYTPTTPSHIFASSLFLFSLFIICWLGWAHAPAPNGPILIVADRLSAALPYSGNHFHGPPIKNRARRRKIKFVKMSFRFSCMRKRKKIF